MTTNFGILRSRLQSERRRLNEELEELKTSSTPKEERRDGSPFGKREEEATETLELEKRLALEKRLKEQLVEVTRALEKFEQGTYGKCDSCGRAIDPARLEALPYAILCMTCKSKLAKEPRLKPTL
ncbi:MAG: TraR/DksA C4-type zinc finger protein [Chloroflexota bacterium]